MSFSLWRNERIAWDTARVSCECNDPVHALQLEWSAPDPKFPQERGEFYAYLVVNRVRRPLHRKVWNCLRYILNRQDVVVGDVVIGVEDARQIARFINRRLQESDDEPAADHGRGGSVPVARP